jgi:hypothetical protein
MPYPTNPVFIAFLDANPTRYKNTPEPDGYNSTQDILNEITLSAIIANPDPVTQVPITVTIASAQAVLSVESLGKLSDSWWDTFNQYLNNGGNSAGTRQDAYDMIANAQSRANLTETEADALRALLDTTEDDPTYSPTIQDDPDCKKEWDLGGFSSSYTDSALGRS